MQKNGLKNQDAPLVIYRHNQHTKKGEHRQCTMYGRPGADVGDVVLLTKDSQTKMAIITAFDTHTYTLAPHVGDSRKCPRQSTDMQWSICIDTPDGNDGWVNAPLPPCCVCLDAAADRVLACRCTVPCVCAGCVRKEQLDRCPQCRHPVASDPHGPHHIYANLYSIESYDDRPRITVFARTTAGKSMILRVHRRRTVRTVKVALFVENGIPVDQQRLSFAGRAMNDAQTLADLGIKECATLHLVLRLMGD